ncbi:hypothetical protein M0804_009961 [Polistes exclamans]|nr:hypothetical protein M0804_009961 [Polistes exclamans]
MANHTARSDIVEVTFQAYARQQSTNEEPTQRRCFHLKIRFVLMAIVSLVVASFIIYWFVNSILVSRNENRQHDLNKHRSVSRKQSYLERLPNQIIPLEYTLQIIPLLTENNFKIIGEVEIQLYCKQSTKHIRLHSHKLNIQNVSIVSYVSSKNNKTYIIENYVSIRDDDFLDIFLLQFLTKDNIYLMKIKYNGDLNEKPVGLFRSKYKDEITNVTRWIAVSNFSPDFARRAFPCFDEPSMKAPFRISIGRKVDMRTHSNSIRIATEKMESSMLLRNNKNQHIDKKKIFAMIASHEVAHQWFGNLVTPKWWSEVWLKEGFSSFFGIKALSMIESSLSVQDIMAMEYREMFKKEEQDNAHPLYLNLNITGKKLSDIFDATPYVKGNCLVNMIFHFLGETIFYSSIKKYIHTYYYRAADQNDLWDIFQEEIELSKLFHNFSIQNIMKGWTNHAGFPVVHVNRNNDTGLVELMQERFYRQDLNVHGTSEELWCIPLTWTIESDQRFDGTLPKAWMHERRMVINDTGLSEAIFNNQWILFNINQTGLYRVNYDEENWKFLINRFDLLPDTTKHQILSDAFAMFNRGLLDQTLIWKFLLKLNVDTDTNVWLLVKDALGYIEYRLWDSHVFMLLAKYHEPKENDKFSLAYALGCTPNSTLIEWFLSSFSTEHIEVTLMAVASNPNAFDLAMEFMERVEKFDEMNDIITNYPFYGFSITMDQEENIKWVCRY